MKKQIFKSIHHVDQETIKLMYKDYSPVFILSTGRSGSKFISKLLALASSVDSFHEPKPTMQYFSNYAYHNQDKKDVLRRMIDATRMEIILESFIKNKIFVESNQCLTFFSIALKDLYKKSKFVHILRHPGDFIRSAIRKGWYNNDSIWEIGRVKKEDLAQWSKMNQVEKLCWLWKMTNQYILNLKDKIDPKRFIVFRIEDLLKEVKVVKKLIKFIGIKDKLPKEKIYETQKIKINEMVIHPNEPPNMKKVKEYPEYYDWKENEKKILKKNLSYLTELYGYKL